VAGMVAQDLPQRCGLGTNRRLVAMSSRFGHHTRASDHEAVTGQEMLHVKGVKWTPYLGQPLSRLKR